MFLMSSFLIKVRKQFTQKRDRFPLLLGMASALTFAQLGLLFSVSQLPAAYAQALTDEDIANYASAAVMIEAKRQAAYEAASDILTAADSELSILDTSLSCTSSAMSDMPDISRENRLDLRTVLVTFCNEARQAAEDNNLTPKRFNDITEAHRADPEVAERIQAAAGAL